MTDKRRYTDDLPGLATNNVARPFFNRLGDTPKPPAENKTISSTPLKAQLPDGKIIDLFD
jgi:hypothetical protein